MENQNKPECKLTGVNGNVYVLLATVTQCLKNHKQYAEAKECTDRVLDAKSYDQALQIFKEYVEVR